MARKPFKNLFFVTENLFKKPFFSLPVAGKPELYKRINYDVKICNVLGLSDSIKHCNNIQIFGNVLLTCLLSPSRLYSISDTVDQFVFCIANARYPWPEGVQRVYFVRFNKNRQTKIFELFIGLVVFTILFRRYVTIH